VQTLGWLEEDFFSTFYYIEYTDSRAVTLLVRHREENSLQSHGQHWRTHHRT